MISVTTLACPALPSSRQGNRCDIIPCFRSRLLALAPVGAALSRQFDKLPAQEKSFLWKVQASENTVYILGSIHLLKRESAALKPLIQEVFGKSKRLVFEIDLLEEDPDKVQQLLMQKGVNLSG